MLIQPAARFRAGVQIARSRPVTSLTRALLLSALTLPAALPTASAESAQDVLKKMAAVYETAKSFQGSVTQRQKGKTRDGKSATLTTTQQLHYKGPNLFHIQISATGTGAAAASASQMGITFVSDGKNIFIYRPAQKKYARQPSPPSLPLSKILRVIPNPATPGLSLLSPTSVQGHAAYVVQVKPTKPPNVPPQQRAQVEAYFKTLKPTQYMIDKQNYHLLKITTAQGTNTSEIEFGPQTINGNVAPALFAFTPPAGTTEMTPPAGGNAPSPGLPGGAPR
jgi:outer membrane lipoprotein-sorting protein